MPNIGSGYLFESPGANLNADSFAFNWQARLTTTRLRILAAFAAGASESRRSL
jgi:hypothetical protein